MHAGGSMEVEACRLVLANCQHVCMAATQLVCTDPPINTHNSWLINHSLALYISFINACMHNIRMDAGLHITHSTFTLETAIWSASHSVFTSSTYKLQLQEFDFSTFNVISDSTLFKY